MCVLMVYGKKMMIGQLKRKVSGNPPGLGGLRTARGAMLLFLLPL